MAYFFVQKGSLASGSATLQQIQLCDLNGRQLQSLSCAAGERTWQINLQQLSAGLYLIAAHSLSGPVIYKKLVVE